MNLEVFKRIEDLAIERLLDKQLIEQQQEEIEALKAQAASKYTKEQTARLFMISGDYIFIADDVDKAKLSAWLQGAGDYEDIFKQNTIEHDDAVSARVTLSNTNAYDLQ